MPFHLTSDQELVRKTVRELLEPVKGKPAEHVDRERSFPADHLKNLAQMGLCGMLVPPEMGGPGTDTVTFALAMEEVARASGTLALVLNNQNALGTFPLSLAASEALRAEVIPPLLTGEKFIAWALSEPQAGSDLSGVSTKAILQGDTYVLNGVKSFVVGAPDAAWLIVFAKVPKTEGLTAFLVPADTKGVMVAPREATMSLRGSDMAQVFLKDVKVPAANVLGEIGGAAAILGPAHDMAALGAAAIAVGLMQASLEDSVAYSGDREQFRTPLKRFQAIQFTVADMDLKVRAARLLVQAAADKRDRNEDASADIAAAKLFAAESARWVTQKGIRIHGGTGFMRDLPVERYNRDARAMSVYAGTTEMERALLAARALNL